MFYESRALGNILVLKNFEPMLAESRFKLKQIRDAKA
jgi:hypothetical protein